MYTRKAKVALILLILFCIYPLYLIYDELILHVAMGYAADLAPKALLYRIAWYGIGIGSFRGAIKFQEDDHDVDWLANVMLVLLGIVGFWLSIAPSYPVMEWMIDFFWGIIYWGIICVGFELFLEKIIVGLPLYMHRMERKYQEQQIKIVPAENNTYKILETKQAQEPGKNQPQYYPADIVRPDDQPDENYL